MSATPEPIVGKPTAIALEDVECDGCFDNADGIKVSSDFGESSWYCFECARQLYDAIGLALREGDR